MNYLFFYLIIGTFLVFSSFARTQALDSDETNNENVNPEDEKPTKNVAIPSNWRQKCLENRPWCDALIDSLIAAKELSRLFDVSPHITLSEEQLSKIHGDCNKRWEAYTPENDACVDRNAFYSQLFGTETPPEMIPFSPDWRKNCLEDRAWCDRFLDSVIASGRMEQLYGGEIPPLSDEAVDKITAQCPSIKCIERNMFYQQLFGEQEDALKQVVK